MDQFLTQLADKLGILTKFVDAGLFRKEYNVDENVIKFFCQRLGYKAGNIQEIAKSLDDFDKRRWQKTLESIYITKQKDLKFDVVVSEDVKDYNFAVTLKNQADKSVIEPSVTVMETGASRQIGRTKYIKLELYINHPLSVGYYDLTLKMGAKKAVSVLAVAPEKCYENPAFNLGKLWGYAVQLYSLRSERNWGVGDFTDLQELIKICSHCGASTIGLNPLNVLHHNYPDNASPYQSISRLFLNPIYIDVEAVPEFLKKDKKAYEEKIKHLRATNYIDYAKVYNLKIEVLAELYQRFLTQKDSKRKKAFEDFCLQHGEELENLAAFQSLSDDKSGNGYEDWHFWEEEYKAPHSVAVRNYAKKNADKIGFFKFLQFEADRQFDLCGDLVKKCDLKVGLYRDLAVGVGNSSAECWSNPDLFIKDVGTGAPPDAFFPQGQKWGLGTFHPYNLKEQAYQPFIKILRANMKNAGGLRIDHVMSLMRLYVIPNDSKDGTYVMYNFEDMLSLVAIESELNKCVIVGESIGNVPDGFLDKLQQYNINSLSIIWAERWDIGWGNFKFPEDYPRDSFVSVGTHDIAPLRAWWFGYDISESRRQGIIETDQEMNEAYKKREVDRWKLLSAMDANSVWPRDNMRQGNYIYGENYPEGIDEAVNRFMARTNSKVFLAELENILHVEKMQNIPGVDKDRHPNWRLKLPVVLEHLEEDIAYIRNVAAIKSER